MKNLHSLVASACLVIPAILASSETLAGTPVSCQTAISGLAADSHWLNVKGVRLTARGTHGFTAFTMQNGFQIETYPVHTPGFASRNTFYLDPNPARTQFSGIFTEVFTDRGNGDEDRWRMRLSTNGKLEIQSITWNGAYQTLQAPVCYRGPTGQIVMTAHKDNPGYGSDFWTFVFSRGILF
jgi:hypothetical protein